MLGHVPAKQFPNELVNVFLFCGHRMNIKGFSEILGGM